MKKVLLVSLISCLWMTACGQKGPLYLPLDQAGRERVDPSVEGSSIEAPDAGLVETSAALS